MALVDCPECGKRVSNHARSCPQCGYPMDDSPGNRAASAPMRVTVQKSRGVAIALAFFLGGVGAHKFYVGKPGVGILYALFIWTFLPMLFGAIEALQYLFMSDETFQKRLVAGKL